MPKFIFVIGSSGTGKSTVSTEIEQIVTELELTVATLNLDHYYLPKNMLDPSKEKNFDIPEALEQSLVRRHLATLEKGESIDRPTYDMPSSDRIIGGEIRFDAKDIIIVEGIFAGEYVRDLRNHTEKLKIYLQSPHVNDNYSRKAERDSVERKKSEAHIKAMKRNQIGCLFEYVATHMNSSDIVIENTWQPTTKSDESKVPMIRDDKKTILIDFLKAEPICSLSF